MQNVKLSTFTFQYMAVRLCYLFRDNGRVHYSVLLNEIKRAMQRSFLLTTNLPVLRDFAHGVCTCLHMSI